MRYQFSCDVVDCGLASCLHFVVCCLFWLIVELRVVGDRSDPDCNWKCKIRIVGIYGYTE